MTFLQWRKCNFFEIYKDDIKNEKLKAIKDVSIASCSSGHGLLILGDVSGLVHKIDRGFNISSFRAYELNLSFVYQLKQSNVLITIGDDESGINPLIKVWNFDKYDKNGNPLCTRICRAIPNNKPTLVSCVVCHENLNYLAVGFQNGSVVLFKGDVMRERGSKQRVIHDGGFQISGLKFKNTPKGCYLFIVTNEDVWSYAIQVKDKDIKVKLDNQGCSSMCITMSDPKSDELLYIAKNDAVYCYTHDSRGPCFAFGGEKLILHWYRSYLVVLSKETRVLPSNTSSSIRENSRPDEFVFTIYDIQNKLVAYVCKLTSPAFVLSEWGSLYMYSADKTIVEFLEKDTQTKLQALFKKNLYDVAIRLSKSQQFDDEGLVEIFRQYGDHLYSKGDYNGAIDQYIKTIGKLEAAYVVRKFLDSQRIHNLTAYLEALHKEALATEDHTTLLLNCYTKLKDKNKLDHFIMKTDKSVDFDVELAIRVCRQSGYSELALWLAKQHNIHHLYLHIQIEDLSNYSEALDYIRALGKSQIKSSLQKYGNVLMTHVPGETTELVKSLFESEPKEKDDSALTPCEYLHLFVEHKSHMKEFVQMAIKYEPSSSLYHTLFELYVDEYTHASDFQVKQIVQTNIMDLLRDQGATYDTNQLLVFFKTTDFTPGILYLYERAHFYYQILHYHMEKNDYNNVLMTCRKYSSLDATLWVKALWYFISVTTPDVDRYIKDILREIEVQKLLPPIMVVEILMKSPVANLGLAREYLMRTFEKENSIIEDDLKIISQYKKETGDIASILNQIQMSVVVFQGSKCNICNNLLSLPSVHFLCQHSFHQHCFVSYCESDNECPACLPQNKKLLEIIRSQDRRRDFHEQFHMQLEKSNDAFSVVADFFGRGAFNNVIVVNDHIAPRKDFNITSDNSNSTLSESRLRLTEVKNQFQTNIQTEGRLRLATRNQAVPVPSEGRLPQNAGPNAGSTQSETRLRLNEKPGQNMNGSPKIGITSKTLPTEASFSIGTPNPFEDDEDYDDTKNPFNSSDNPFGEEDDDYDSSLNPFS